jgi:tetratricopeptide (TPR) repeat protein
VDLVSKLAAVILGLAVAVYGSLEVWLSHQSYDDPAARRFCAAWLCPEEFSEARTALLHQAGQQGHSAYVLREFQRAVLLDSASAYRWADLAEAEAARGLLDAARYSLRRALAAGPGNPAILFRAADFEWRMGDAQASIRNAAAILRNPELSAFDADVFSLYARMLQAGQSITLNDILKRGIPPSSPAALSFLDFWIDRDQLEEAQKTWHWLLDRSLVDARATGKYTDFLIRCGHPQEAAAEWKQGHGAGASQYAVSNWIFNGGFEQVPKPGPFDWHMNTGADGESSRTRDRVYQGKWSLKLQGAESGRAANSANENSAYQETVVQKGDWRLRAYIKTDRVGTAEGIALHVYDVEEPARLGVATAAFSGTKDWTLVNQVFAVGPETKLVRVEVVRQAQADAQPQSDRTFGTAWLDALELSPVH